MGTTLVAYVTPDVIAWARNLDGVSIEDAAKAAGVKIEKIQAWENGQVQPTVNQAKKLARKYRVPYVYFFLPAPPAKYKRPIYKDYRKFAFNLTQSHQSAEISFLVRDVLDRREAMLEIYDQLNYIPKEFINYIDLNNMNETKVADHIRNLIELTKYKQIKFRNSEKAFKYYINAFEDLGILVFQAAGINPYEMRGMSIYNNIFPIIILNRKDEVSARIFTMFHELVHLITRTPGICDDMQEINNRAKGNIEVVCNRIAAKVLVPDKLINESEYVSQLKNGIWEDENIRKFARDYAVSREVILGRLYSLKIISRDLYLEKLDQYTDEYSEYAKRKKKDGFLPPSTDIYSQVGKLYAKTVLSAFNQEIITSREASAYLSGLRLQHFDKLQRWCF